MVVQLSAIAVYSDRQTIGRLWVAKGRRLTAKVWLNFLSLYG